MANLLLWLAVPLLLVPWLVPANRIGAAAAQLLLAGAGLAALHQGAGTLDPVDLRAIAQQTPHDAWFVGISAGFLIAGGCLFSDVRDWRRGLAALPLVVGLLVAALPHIGPLAIGLVIGAVPAWLGMLAGATTAAGKGPVEPPVPGVALSLLLAAATVVAALVGPLVLTMLGLGVLAWRERIRCRRAGRAPYLPMVELGTTLLLAGWTWFALTIAGAPFLSFRTIASDAPISPTAGQGLALLAIGWAVGLAAPWPLDRLTRTTVQLPAAAVVIHLVAVQVIPDGIAHWQPLLSIALVGAAVAAMASRRWDGAAAALMLIGATRGGALPFGGAMIMALVPATRRLALPPRAGSAMTGVGTALVLAGLLQDEVLLSVVLAIAAAVCAVRADYLVAPVPESVHL